MQKTKIYYDTRFTEDVLRDAAQVMRRQVPLASKDTESTHLEVEVDGAEWNFDTEEEFFADYRRSTDRSIYQLTHRPHSLRIHTFRQQVNVTVQAPMRPEIEAVFARFEQAHEGCRLPELVEPPSEEMHPVVFIGHGRNPLWRDLKDHLHEKHGFRVTAYEIGARAGHAIRDVLEDMLAKSSFALLVMTAEDDMADGDIRARQNVVHEAGLFQGRLGFRRAVVLVEAGTSEFSNMQGIELIHFSSGGIKETFGEVVATIRREFPAS